MHRLRADVFKHRLNWDVRLLGDWEIDHYDSLDPFYLFVWQDDLLIGSWRLLPTQGPYMLRDEFPQLLAGRKAPAEEGTWEMSRFVLRHGVAQDVAGFTAQTLHVMRAAARFAVERGIYRYVTVTTTALERMLGKTLLPFNRMGPACQIGRTQTVALSIPMGAAALSTLLSAEMRSRARLEPQEA